MADIELVIKIPEEVYEVIINDKSTKMLGFAKAVKNGIPLPNGHGRLIDVDNIQEIELEDSLTVLTHTKGDEVAWRIDAPTILEANDVRDKGCSTCPYVGHIELKECQDAYTEKAKECKNYNHEQFVTKAT